MESTIVKSGYAEQEILGSRFFGYAFPVSCREEVERHLAELGRKYPDATHIVYAFRIGEGGAQEHFTDAGEPSGTAGAPIMKFLHSRKITNILVAVVRYFGGTKLGTGGLVRAYSRTAQMAVEDAGVVPFVKMVEVEFAVPYSVISQIRNFVGSAGGDIIGQDFAEQVTISAKIPEEKLLQLVEFVRNITRGSSEVHLKRGS